MTDGTRYGKLIGSLLRDSLKKRTRKKDLKNFKKVLDRETKI